VVIAGNKSAVERGVALAQSAGAKRAIMLAVSVPSHCALMKEAADALAARLNETQITAPAIPVINNVDVTAQTDPDAIRNALARQLHNPVRWVETIQALKAQGAEKFIECGPGKVLAGLNKRIDRSLDTYAIFDSASLEKTLASFEQALTS
jgi:[acyl-carrier-protein] S-malonyltransferase